MNGKHIITGVAIGLWVSVYVAIQILVAGVLGIENVEIWPALMAPGLIGLLGGGKEGMKKYYKMAVTGVLAGCVFVLLEYAMVPVMGNISVLFLLAVVIALIVILGAVAPNWFGSTTFIVFTAATILKHDILVLTLTRLVVLLVGTTIFLFGQQWIIKIISKPKATNEVTAGN